MDASAHQPMPNTPPAPPAPAPPAAAPQEATGDSESDAPVSALTAGDYRPSVAAAGYAEDDAESCSGAGGVRVPAASVNDDDAGRGEDDDVAVEGDENEVDSRMCVPWWRRTVVQMDAAAGAGAGGGCARPQAAAAEGGAAAVVVAAGASHAAESNRLFWEACIAHGY